MEDTQNTRVPDRYMIRTWFGIQGIGRDAGVPLVSTLGQMTGLLVFDWLGDDIHTASIIFHLSSRCILPKYRGGLPDMFVVTVPQKFGDWHYSRKSESVPCPLFALSPNVLLGL